MRLTLQHNDKPAYGQGVSYVVPLRADERAVLEAVNEGSWRLIIHRLGTVVDRGLFGSTHDILTLLEAELFPMSS